MFKKLLALALSATMLMSMGATAFAAETEPNQPTELPAYSVTINEYDVYVQTREASQSELETMGISPFTLSR